jgi:hypothetical protein
MIQNPAEPEGMDRGMDKIDYRAPWYHGSPAQLTCLRAGSTITQARRLAEVFSHKPALVCLADDGTIRHNGSAPGFLYRVAEPVGPEDVVPHPRSSMEAGLEWLITRELAVILLGTTTFGEDEMLSDAEVAALLGRLG